MQKMNLQTKFGKKKWREINKRTYKMKWGVFFLVGKGKDRKYANLALFIPKYNLNKYSGFITANPCRSANQFTQHPSPPDPHSGSTRCRSTHTPGTSPWCHLRCRSTWDRRIPTWSPWRTACTAPSCWCPSRTAALLAPFPPTDCRGIRWDPRSPHHQHPWRRVVLRYPNWVRVVSPPIYCWTSANSRELRNSLIEFSAMRHNWAARSIRGASIWFRHSDHNLSQIERVRWSF